MIETPRLFLRTLRATDEDAMFAYQSDPEVVRYVPWPVRSREAVRTALAPVIDRVAHEDTGDFMLLGLERKIDGVLLGQCNLGIESREDGHGEIGYVVAREYAGNGFATEASRALIEFAFTRARLHRVTATMDARNAASAAVCEKLGMRREAHFIENEWFKGEWSSTFTYAILQSEWQSSTRA